MSETLPSCANVPEHHLPKASEESQLSHKSSRKPTNSLHRNLAKDLRNTYERSLSEVSCCFRITPKHPAEVLSGCLRHTFGPPRTALIFVVFVWLQPSSVNGMIMSSSERRASLPKAVKSALGARVCWQCLVSFFTD